MKLLIAAAMAATAITAVAAPAMAQPYGPPPPHGDWHEGAPPPHVKHRKAWSVTGARDV